jgi:glycosyltransferase involved in cell wall biosynthesis
MAALRVGLNLVPQSVHGGGVARYADELVRALAARDDVEATVWLSRDGPAPWVPGVRWRRLPVGLAGPPLHLLAQYGAVPAGAAALGLDVLHSPAGAGPVRVPGLASVVTVHDLTWAKAGLAWGSAAEVAAMRRWSLPTARRAELVIAISESAALDLAGHGVDRDRVAVVPQGVRPPAVAPAPSAAVRARFALPAEARIVLCVAQKRPYKGHADLIRALPAVPPDAVLVLPGAPTPYEGELRNLAAALGLADRVRFPAYVDDADLEGLYAVAACFALASRHEGFGLPVLEAMVRGVPVACADRESLPEVAGDAAVLFEPDDVGSIAAAVGRVLGDGALAAELRRRGEERARAFTWARTAEGTVAAYRRALALRRAS